MDYISPTEFAKVHNANRLYELLEAAGMSGPGWEKREPLATEPKKNFLPAHWKYSIAKAALDAVGKIVSNEIADRRTLRLFNQVPGNTYATLRTLRCAYQMVLPGESARSHRHTANALRLVMESSSGNHTVVNGKRIPMLPGDVVLTPNWSWHGHHNESTGCAYWIDFLDTPAAHYFGSMFFEALPGGGIEGSDQVEERSPMRFPFSEISHRLDAQSADRAGLKSMELGPPTLDTIALHVWRLDAGQSIARGRTTANTIFAVIDGEGTSFVDGAEFQWGCGDVIAVPAWHECRHKAHSQSHLLRVTDEPLLRRLNWLRNSDVGDSLQTSPSE